jgi:dihydropteroate synthase
MLLRAGSFKYVFPRPALVMGIVNVTPDSFSDGGQFLETGAAVAHAFRLTEQGADIIDIGGESTRPHAAPVTEAEELRRVIPVIERLSGQLPVPISIDTMKPGVARAAIQAGASIVNDVGANRQDEAMWRVVAEAGAGYVAMHMQGTPQTMQNNPAYIDVVHEVHEFFFDRIRRLSDCGVPPERVILDPGIGFGKAHGHNMQLLGELARFTDLERPLLIGVSRKSFLGKFSGAEIPSRLPAALACVCLAVEAGAQIVRAHEVAETVATIRAAEAIIGSRRRDNVEH